MRELLRKALEKSRDGVNKVPVYTPKPGEEQWQEGIVSMAEQLRKTLEKATKNPVRKREFAGRWKSVFYGSGTRGIKRAPQDVIERVAKKLNETSGDKFVRYTGSAKEASTKHGQGMAARPRVVTRDGEAFLVLHRGVMGGGRNALTGKNYSGWWQDAKAASGLPASTDKRVALNFAGPKTGKSQKARAGVQAGSRGRFAWKTRKPNVGTYLLPENEIGKSYVRPMAGFGPEWEVRNANTGKHLVRLRKREFGAGVAVGLLTSPLEAVAGAQAAGEKRRWWGAGAGLLGGAGGGVGGAKLAEWLARRASGKWRGVAGVSGAIVGGLGGGAAAGGFVRKKEFGQVLTVGGKSMDSAKLKRLKEFAKPWRGITAHYHPMVPVKPGKARGYIAKQVLGHQQVPARGSGEAAAMAAKLRVYKGAPVTKEVEAVRREIRNNPRLAEQAKLSGTPGLAVHDAGYPHGSEIYKKGDRYIKQVIDDANKVVARHGRDAVSVSAGIFGNPNMHVKRWLARRMHGRLKEFASGSYRKNDAEAVAAEQGSLKRTGLMAAGIAGGLALGGLALRSAAGKEQIRDAVARAVGRMQGSRRRMSHAKQTAASGSQRAGMDASIEAQRYRVAQREAAMKSARDARRADVAHKQSVLKSGAFSPGEKRSLRAVLDRARGKKEFATPEITIVRQKRDNWNRARDAAVTGAGAGVLGAAGYGIYKIRQTSPQWAGSFRTAADKVGNTADAVKEVVNNVGHHFPSKTEKGAPVKPIARSIDDLAASVSRGPIGAEGMSSLREKIRKQMTTFPTFGKYGRKIANAARAARAAAGRVKLFAVRGADVRENERRPMIGALGAAGLGVGLGVGAGAMALPGLRRIERVVKKSARSIGSAAGQAQKTGQNVKDATTIGADLGKVYRWAKSAVGGGVYNVLHPVQTAREMRGAFRAGLRGEKSYPKARRPAWALQARLARLKEFAAGDRRRHWEGVNRPLQTDEGGIPFSGVAAKDRYIKQIRDQDLDRRDANMARAGAAGALAGPLVTRRGSISAKAALGALAGVGSVLGVRRATESKKDVYGERSRGAKRVEHGPAIAGLGLAGVLAAKRLKFFEDYRLYYFRGRNTGIAARSAEEARAKKKRGGDELVAVRTPNESESAAMRAGRWVRTRRDGKSPEKSKYGKGRGQGPPRKKEFAAGRDREQKKGMNPYVMAGLSGGLSGAVLGAAPILRRGWTKGGVAASMAKLGAASAGIVGGGAYIGSKIIGAPTEDEGSAFTRRAAIGGTMVGAGMGLLGGAVATNRGLRTGLRAIHRRGGVAGALAAPLRKAVVSTQAGVHKGAREWTPLAVLKKSGPVGGAFVGAGGGGAYGLYQGLDEGQQVDSILNVRRDLQKAKAKSSKALSRLWLRKAGQSRLKEFGKANQPRIEDYYTDDKGEVRAGHDHMRFANYIESKIKGQTVVSKTPGGDYVPTDFRAGQVLKSAYNEGKGIHKWTNRIGGLGRDTVNVLRGKPRDRDASGRPRKREWEKSWFQNAAGAAVGGAGVLGALHVATKTSWGRKHVRPLWQKGLRMKEEYGFAAKLERLKGLKEFDEIAAERGWDVRDPRGRSARVFAPGSRRRERREKQWYERAENERKMWAAGVIGSLGLGVGGSVLAYKMGKGSAILPRRGQAGTRRRVVPVKFPAGAA